MAKHGAKLTAEQVIAIVEMHKDGVASSKIAEVYRVSYDTIYKIISGTTWSSATGITKEIKIMDDFPGLNFRKIPDFDGYFVTECGRVFSNINLSFTELSQVMGNNGYKRVGIRGKLYSIHRLVCLTFNGKPPKGMNIVRHLDGNPVNNHFSNLAWGTQADNSADMVSHGTRLLGEKTNNSKLTKKKVKEIRKLLKDGARQVHIAEMFGITQNAISSIKRKRTWAWLEE